jgi:hypothetical protein
VTPRGAARPGDVRYTISPDAAYAALEDGAVVLNLHTKRYYSLNETGALIWAMLEDSASMDEIVQRLVAQYEIGAGEARASLDRLLRELEGERLVTAEPR